MYRSPDCLRYLIFSIFARTQYALHLCSGPNVLTALSIRFSHFSTYTYCNPSILSDQAGCIGMYTFLLYVHCTLIFTFLSHFYPMFKKNKNEQKNVKIEHLSGRTSVWVSTSIRVSTGLFESALKHSKP